VGLERLGGLVNVNSLAQRYGFKTGFLKLLTLVLYLPSGSRPDFIMDEDLRDAMQWFQAETRGVSWKLNNFGNEKRVDR
jgi:hypothetical protein